MTKEDTAVVEGRSVSVMVRSDGLFSSHPKEREREERREEGRGSKGDKEER